MIRLPNNKPKCKSLKNQWPSWTLVFGYDIEIKQLKESQKAAEKQWNEAVSAMSKRDGTFQMLDNNREKLKNDLIALQTENKALKNEATLLSGRLNDKTKENLDLSQKLSEYTQMYKEASAKASTYSQELIQAQKVETAYTHEVDALKKDKMVFAPKSASKRRIGAQVS